MKMSIEFGNGLLIFAGIALYFFIMNLLGLSDKNFLRIFNIVIVYFGIYRTLKQNFKNGNFDYAQNLMSSIITATVGVTSSVLALWIYIYAQGGQLFLNHLSQGFLFAGKPSVAEYCFGILFEGIASSLIVVFVSMQYWQGKTKVYS